MASGNCALSLLWMASLVVITTQEFYASGGRYGKRTEIAQDLFLPDDPVTNRPVRAPSMFWSGSRYGRGSVDDVAQPKVEVEQRAFYMGSRYGKRNERLSGAEVLSMENLSCQYTGVVDLYRCTLRKYLPENAGEEDVSSN